MLLVIAKAIELNSIGLIYSDAGRGKSLTLRAAVPIFPGSILARVVTGTATAAGFATLIFNAAGLRGGAHKGTLTVLSKLIDKLRDSGRALMMLDELRSLTAETRAVLTEVRVALAPPPVDLVLETINRLALSRSACGSFMRLPRDVTVEACRMLTSFVDRGTVMAWVKERGEVSRSAFYRFAHLFTVTYHALRDEQIRHRRSKGL